METGAPLTEKHLTKASNARSDGTDLENALEHLRRFLAEGNVEGARLVARELERRWPESDDVQYWARVLAPPKTRVRHGERGRPVDRERAWLSQHSGEYPGCWLAVFGDELIAADPDLGTVLQTVRQTPGAENAVLYYQPPIPQ
jgi:hypothetical protein